MSKNLIVAPCGNNSTFFKEYWLADKENAHFDLCLLFYHEEVQIPESSFNGVEYFYHLRNYKYKMIHELFTNINPSLLNKYEYFYFIDDDIKISTDDINRMFSLTDALDLWIAQSSLTYDSICSWPVLKHKKNSLCRFVGQVEVMAPLFSKYALLKCIDTFNINDSSWGLDLLWTYTLSFPEKRIAVIDLVEMGHYGEIGVSELYQKINFKHRRDFSDIKSKYNLKNHYFGEHARIQLIDFKTSPFLFSRIKIKELFQFTLQRFNDLGIDYYLRKYLLINNKNQK